MTGYGNFLVIRRNETPAAASSAAAPTAAFCSVLQILEPPHKAVAALAAFDLPGEYIGPFSPSACLLFRCSLSWARFQTSRLILHGAVGLAQTMSGWAVVLFIYLIVLVMNFFIPSGSAKAFILIPLIVPMAQIFGISAQLCVVAFAFGNGFFNVFYPTTPAPLIALWLMDVSYSDWFKWSLKFKAMNLVLTSLIPLSGLAVGH